MVDLVSLIKTNVVNFPSNRIRSRRGFFASEAETCPRELYWDWIGEPPTNPTDYKGKARMKFGSAIEGAIGDWLNRIHLQGVHLIDSQISVGGVNPTWDGLIDFLLLDRTKQPSEYIVVEVKSVWGYGADLLLRDRMPKRGHMFQVGLYLKDYYDKGKPRKGMLLYYVVSDNNLSEMVQFNCEYLPETNEVICYEEVGVDGAGNIITKTICNYSLDYVINKWQYVITCIENKEVPKPEYRYKYAVTDELLQKLSDRDIKSALEESKIIGDWQPAYSKYKNKIIEVDGIIPYYTLEELDLFYLEYKRRHPKTRIERPGGLKLAA